MHSKVRLQFYTLHLACIQHHIHQTHECMVFLDRKFDLYFMISNKIQKLSSFKSNENIHKREDGSYYVVSKLNETFHWHKITRVVQTSRPDHDPKGLHVNCLFLTANHKTSELLLIFLNSNKLFMLRPNKIAFRPRNILLSCSNI